MNENDMYHADSTRIGKSGLDLIAQCPAKYYAKYIDPNREREKKTPALILGSALHTIILEPFKFNSEFAVKPVFSGDGARSRESEWIENNRGKQPITLEQYQTVSRMRDSVAKHPLFDDLFSEGVAEQRIDFDDWYTGAKCKAKPDFRNTRNGLIVDLKTTEDASDRGFAKSAYTYRYYVQAPFYFDGAQANGLNPTGFVFVAIEKEPPYLVNIFYADDEFMDAGRTAYRNDLETYLKCLETGTWPGYSEEIKPLRLPAWANK